MKTIDLRSDTVTKPSEEMRRAIASAEVGDDVWGDDPTVNKLEKYVAELFNVEASLYVPSGTMGNQVALKTLTQPGWEILCERESHILYYEAAGPAVHSQLLVHMIDTERGIFSAEEVKKRIHGKNVHEPLTKVVAIENTHNRHSGTIFPLDEIKRICEVCNENDLVMHLDGARIWNAHMATGISLADWVEPFDSVSVCLSKGLGAPVGAMILGTSDFIERARRNRKLFGGGMRQAGLLAAAALYALENNLQNLKDDHANAKLLAEGLNKVDSFDIDLTKVETNIVQVDISKTGKTAMQILDLLKAEGLLCSPSGPTQIRFVTHLDVSTEDCQKAVEIVSQLKLK